MSARILDLELTAPLNDVDLGAYHAAFVLLRYRGRPVGSLRLACPDGILRADELRTAIASDPELNAQLATSVLHDWLVPEPKHQARPLSWSVVICTRDRTDDLRRCLDALMQLPRTNGEIVIVDNAPSSDATAQLVAKYPVHYLLEPVPGLNRARAAGARAATGEIVLYTDDDVVVDPRWVAAALEPFVHPRVAAVTGLTLPLELDAPAQELFETYGGFGRGFKRRTFDYTGIAPAAAGMVGAGANMAFRRELVVGMGLFDAPLDCGTVTRTGGDAYAFYQLLAEGHQIVYTPEALVWHRHRRDYAALRRTLAGYSVGGFAFLTRCLLEHRDGQALAVAASWFWHDHIHQLGRVLLRKPRALPLDLVLAQLVACPLGPWAYLRSRRLEQRPQAAEHSSPALSGGQA